MRFAKIVEFQQNLTDKIIATYKKSQTDKTYTTFLKHFGSFDVAKIETRSRNREEIILEELQNVKTLLLRQSHRIPETRSYEDIEKRRFIVHAIEKALENIGTKKANSKKKDIGNLVLNYIISHENVSKYFNSLQEVSQLVENYLPRMLPRKFQ